VRVEKRAQIGLPVSAAGTGVVRVSASDRQSAPSFAQLGSSDKSEGSGGGKIAIVAIVLVAIAAGGYFGYTKLHQQSSAPTVETPQQPEMAVPAPNATTAATSGTFTVSMQKAAEAAETAPSVSATPTSHKPDAGKVIDSEPEVVVTKIEPKPTVVKSASHGASKPQEADVQAPEMLAATGSDQSAISSIMSSAPLSVPVAAPVPSPMLKVSQGVTQGLLMKRVQPIYPRQAMQMHISGSVQLQAVISKTGSISSMKTLSGDPVLAHAAMDAVKQWKYKPYMLDGEPVDIQTQVTVNFKLP
jgi:TonB family protein